MTARRSIGGFAAVLAILTGLAAGSAGAQAGDGSGKGRIACGERVKADVTLRADLVDCPNNGIVIAADGITVDLNGHRIAGDGAQSDACADGGICDVGVANNGHDGVRIADGSVRGFAVGVAIARVRGNRLTGLSATGNEFFGALVASSSRSVVRDSSLSHNTPPEGDGLGLFGSHRIRIVGNSIRGNAGPGIHVGGSNRNLVQRNRLIDDSPALLVEGNRNTLRRNRVRSGAGILIGAHGDRNSIVANRVAGATDSLAVELGRGNLVARNRVVEPDGAGIRLGIGNPFIGGGHNLIRGNRVTGGNDDAYRVYGKDGHSRLLGNVAAGAAGDGFAVDNGTTVLAGNRAVRNGGRGISAVAGVIDGGGNVARRNGDAPQCRHVACG